MPITKKDLDKKDQDDTLKRKEETLSSSTSEKVKPKPSKKVERVPDVGMFSKVTVYAHKVNHVNFRFSLVPNEVYPEAWKKEMSGAEAVQMLRGIQRNNRQGKLESKLLPE